MPVSNESKQAIRKEINELNRLRRNLVKDQRSVERELAKIDARIDSIDDDLVKLNADLTGP